MQVRILQQIKFKSGYNRNLVFQHFTKSPYSSHLLSGLTHLPSDCITDPIFRLEEPSLVFDSESEDDGAHNHWNHQHSYDKLLRLQHRLRVHNPATRTIYVSDCDPAEDVP